MNDRDDMTHGVETWTNECIEDLKIDIKSTLSAKV
jgi:hypothetical protein